MRTAMVACASNGGEDLVEVNGRMTALVTGASYGIGRELALACARGGQDLVLVARSTEKLEALANQVQQDHRVSARVVEADLSDPASPARIFDHLAREGVTIDVLVNNAGFGSSGPFAESDLANELQMIDVNVRALTTLTRIFLPGMLERRRGRVLNVASTAAFQPGPLMAVYYATKAYVLSFSEALAEELAGTGVTVTALCPGPTASEFQRRAHLERSRLIASGLMDPETVADVGYGAMMAGKTVAIPGLLNKILAQVAVRVGPRFAVRKIVKALNSSAG